MHICSAENNYLHSIKPVIFYLPFKKNPVNFHSISIDFCFMTKGIKWNTLYKMGSSHLHLLYYQRVYTVVTNSQTLRPYRCLNGNWVIKSGSSARVILHLPVIPLFSFDGRLVIKGLKTFKAKFQNWGLLDTHTWLFFFFTC